MSQVVERLKSMISSTNQVIHSQPPEQQQHSSADDKDFSNDTSIGELSEVIQYDL